MEILATKEMKSGHTAKDLESALTEKTKKIKIFARDYMNKLCAKREIKRQAHRKRKLEDNESSAANM